jgi:hypothetical protein
VHVCVCARARACACVRVQAIYLTSSVISISNGKVLAGKMCVVGIGTDVYYTQN